VRRDDIPVTSPIQTLVDLATELESIPLERAVNDSDKRGLVDPETLREELGHYDAQAGVRPLRHLLDKLFFRLSDSDLEIYFRRIVRGAKLSMPLSKAARRRLRSRLLLAWYSRPTGNHRFSNESFRGGRRAETCD